MSTNKTPNYNLHAWEPGDDFLRREFNENFAALDTAVHGGFTDLDSKISQARTALETSISENRTALETSISQTHTALDTKINGNFTTLDNKISGNFNTLNTAISQNRAALDTVVNQNIPALNTSMNQALAALAALDAGAVRMIFGSYTGAADNSVSTPQRIEVGVAPRAVFIFSSGGCMGSNGYACLAAPGYHVRSAMPVDESGFTVVNLESDVKYNVKNYTYRYLVLY